MDQVEVALESRLNTPPRTPTRPVGDSKRSSAPTGAARRKLWDAVRRPRAPPRSASSPGWSAKASRWTSPRLKPAFAPSSRERSGHDPKRRLYRTRRPRVQHRLAARNSAKGPVRRVEAADPRSAPPRGEPSTAVDVLEQLAVKHPLPRLLIEHRQLAKLKSTYLDALWTIADDGRPRSTPRSTRSSPRPAGSAPATRTSRTSRSRTEDGGQIRQAFVPGFPRLVAPHRRLFADRAAHPGPIPARTPPWSTPSPTICDIHAAVAARIFKVSEAEVTEGPTGRGEDGEFRRDLRHERLRPRHPPGDQPVRRPRASSTPISRAIRGVDAFITRTLEDRP